jgi:hypothetical protein
MKRKTNQESMEFNILKICINYLALEGEGEVIVSSKKRRRVVKGVGVKIEGIERSNGEV